MIPSVMRLKNLGLKNTDYYYRRLQHLVLFVFHRYLHPLSKNLSQVSSFIGISFSFIPLFFISNEEQWNWLLWMGFIYETSIYGVDIHS